ncbi:hypothetical protein HYFRA_00003896 [Hymenoscyphus fraxineus]|uniref:RING-type domain-containing protein n=1 Tax=Hymenoscyphus fraxineus TaxID=746836 RepID=A0A9N9PK15_9HELO|nr:hypothetical protein HYFRA_00003896 [Hymenoscyphus fraxineus]
MATPYEVEHNIKPSGTPKPNIRPDMSSLFALLSEIQSTNPHSLPTPADILASERLVADQLNQHLLNASSPTQTAFLESLLQEISQTMESPPEKIQGVPQSYLDELERVPKKQLKEEDRCPICQERFLGDDYPLVVVLPCHGSHRFDLECVGPWLMVHGTCPMDRKEVMKRKVEVLEDSEEEDDGGLYA